VKKNREEWEAKKAKWGNKSPDTQQNTDEEIK